MLEGLGSVIVLVGGVVWLLPLLLLARCSHWTHATHAKLDETNRLLALLVQSQARVDVEASFGLKDRDRG